VCEEFGVETEGTALPGIAFGLAGGIGNTGAACGAVVGAVMALSLVRGRPQSMGDALAELRVPQEFRRRFEAEMGTISCRELTGLDLTSESGRGDLMNSDVAQKVCFPAVATAYRLVSEMLKEGRHVE